MNGWEWKWFNWLLYLKTMFFFSFLFFVFFFFFIRDCVAQKSEQQWLLYVSGCTKNFIQFLIPVKWTNLSSQSIANWSQGPYTCGSCVCSPLTTFIMATPSISTVLIKPLHFFDFLYVQTHRVLVIPESFRQCLKPL